MSIRRRNGRYQVRYPGARSKTFTLRKDAERYEADLKRRAELGELYREEPESFGEALDGYLERRKVKRQHRASTAKRHADTAKALASLRETPLPRLSADLVDVALVQIARTAPNQAQKALTLLKAVLRDAEGRQRIDRAVLALEPPRYEEREARFLTEAQLHELATWIPEYVRRIVPVAGLTGMRQGELLDLTDADLCLDGCSEDPDPHLHVRRGKTKAARRRVALIAEVVTLLREQLLVRPIGGEAHLSATAESQELKRGRAAGNEQDGRLGLQSLLPAGLVFPTPTGLRWERNRFMERVFRPATRYAGLDGVTFHDLRHSFVSIAASHGMSREAIGEQVGWEPRSAAVNFARYRHLFPGERRREIAKLEAPKRRRRGA